MKRKSVFVFVVLMVFVLSIVLTGCGEQQQQQSGENKGAAETKTKYPERAINVIIGFAPGGPTDLIGRGILPILQQELGVGIGITNMPGAASATAASNVLSQPKDGYTLFFGSEIMSIWQTMGVIDLNPTRDFIPIKLVSQAIPVIAVPPDSKFNKVEDFIKFAKENPSKLRIGTAGPGTVPHISGLLLEKELGSKFTFVPYDGGRPAVTAVMGGQVDATIEMVQSMVEAYKGNKLKILASFTNEPISGLETIPAIGKVYPQMSKYLPYGPYFGLFAAKGTPQEVIDVLKAGMDNAVKDPKWLDYCKKLYLVPIDYSGEEAIKFLNDWTSKSAWILYDAGGAKKSPAEFGIPRPQQ
ncbi:tripartite tricarboxylate transporter substrate binding protein [Thermoanaerobacterium sp. DL9XJH110]|uniref:tripartite tricarboxylate transporter substrate binding protein n=1 Tax=Thermoanaerobacterium sp. DL9XJH110 TaxID=3386643 RepID=UPI003BB6D1EC